MKQKFRWNAACVFFVVSLAVYFVSALVLMKTRGAAWDGLIFSKGADRFMDFFNHVRYARILPETYQSSFHACFPPLIYLFYHAISRFVPPVFVKYPNAQNSYAVMVYVVYVAVLAVLLLYVIIKLARVSMEQGLLVFLCVFLSYSFLVGAIERGNSVFIALIFLCASMWLKEKDSAFCRELALVFLAIAAAIKIYPAVFGLLYLREKRFQEVLRLIAYGLFFFFAPFVLVGGIEGFTTFLANQLRVQGGSFLGKYTTFSALVSHFGWPVNGMALSVLFGAASAVCLLLRSKQWEICCVLTACMTLLPVWSGEYTVILFTLPLLLFLREERGALTVWNAYCAVLFGMIFTLLAFPDAAQKLCFFGVYALSLSTVVKLLVQGFATWRRQRKVPCSTAPAP